MGLELRDIFRVWFALTLVVTFLAIGLLTHIGAGLHCVGLLAERSHHTFSVLCSCLGFRFLLLVNPQIRVTHVGDWDGLTEQGAKMILMNHTSFMDFFLFTAALPLRLVKSSHVRTVISSSLTKIPIVGPAMGSHAGSFVVYFQAKGSGFGKGDATDFSVDREKQQVQTLPCCFYPKGEGVARSRISVARDSTCRPFFSPWAGSDRPHERAHRGGRCHRLLPGGRHEQGAGLA